jgi:hypothetical protein
MSPDDLYDLPEMKELVDVIMAETGKVLDAFAVKRDSHYITSMMGEHHSSQSSPGHSVHPNCFLSGLVYIKTPMNCGPTLFASPRKFTFRMRWSRARPTKPRTGSPSRSTS